LVLCVDLSLCSFSCCELLGFCCRAILWPGSSVFCIAGDRDRYLNWFNLVGIISWPWKIITPNCHNDSDASFS
jgi:hypothetical protein